MSKPSKPRTVRYHANTVRVESVTLHEMTLVVEASTTTGIPVEVRFEGACLNVFRQVGTAMHDALDKRAEVFERDRQWFERTQRNARKALQPPEPS